MPKSPSKKILLIRFSSIGDIVLTTPVIRCLKKQTNATIHFITKQSFLTVLQNNPYVDKVIGIKEVDTTVIKQLKSEKYDLIIDLHKNLRSQKIKFALGIKSYAFNKINIEKWLMVNFKINKLPKIHIVDRYLDTLKPLDVVNDGQGLDYFIKDGVEEELKAIDLTKPYIAFAIGAAHLTKRLPNEKIIEICQQVRQKIYLLGGPADQENGQIIAQASGLHTQNLAGQTSLDGSAFLVRSAQLVITHDTGMMHIAAAFNKKIISIWGNTIPAFGMYPYFAQNIYNNTIVEQEGLSCRPCSKIGYKTCPKHHFNCMKQQNVREIVNQISSILT